MQIAPTLIIGCMRWSEAKVDYVSFSRGIVTLPFAKDPLVEELRRLEEEGKDHATSLEGGYREPNLDCLEDPAKSHNLALINIYVTPTLYDN